MSKQQTLLESLEARGISRRSFMKFCAITASSLALSGREAQAFIEALKAAPKPTVIWLSFQQCTGCSESILRSFTAPLPEGVSSLSIEDLILQTISLDYHETLQVAAGYQAEAAKEAAIENGGYVLIVDGSIPIGEKAFWSCAAGNSSLANLQHAVNKAGLVVALGTCAAFGGIPAAAPNPSNAWGYQDVVEKGLLTGDLPPFVNISGCPPMAAVITGTVALYLSVAGNPNIDAKKLLAQKSDTNPDGILDGYNRPLPFFGKSVHETCPRHDHWQKGEFATSHGDAAARQGWCLLHLGCRGPEANNSCTRLGWNTDPADGGKFKHSPTHAGHGCLGCSEPGFWDKGAFDGGKERFKQGFYTVQQT
jgi:hydrogenase small subunit